MKYIYAEIEYIGTNYNGFQSQTNGITIESVLTQAIYNATGEKVKVVGSGRTDAGVHALGQAINFHINCDIPSFALAKVINKFLPNDVRIIRTMQVDDQFNARYSAKKKTYLYKVYLGDDISVFDKNFYGVYSYNINKELLKKSLLQLIGTHNFKAFMSSGSQVKDTVRTIYSTKVKTTKNTVSIEITGNGFLYNMVRIIVGTVLDIAAGRLPTDTIKNMLASGDRKLGGRTFVPCGLYLKKVCYNFKK